MYDTLYSSNYFTNFFSSTLFIFLIICNSFVLSSLIKNNNIKLFGDFSTIILFFITFLFFSIIFNILLIFDQHSLFRQITYFFTFLILIFITINFKYIKNLPYIISQHFLKSNFTTKIIAIVFGIFFFISILPISDADSIALHNYFSSFIFSNGLSNLDIIRFFEFSLFTNSEILLLFSPILKSDNFGAQLNLITFFLFFLLKYKSNHNFFLFVISCPLIIFFISTQKLQLFFSILFLILFILVHERLIKNKIEILFFTLLLFFYISGKLSYILIGGPLLIYFFFTNLKHHKFILISSLVSSSLTLFPILYLKYSNFGNPFLPFLDKYFLDRSIMEGFVISVRSSEGWMFNLKDIKIFLKPFIPMSLGALTNSLGILLLLFLFNFSLLKRIYFFPFIIILLVVSTGQLLPRYYFESFLLLAFFYKQKKSLIVKYITYSQLFAVIIFSVTFIIISYVGEKVFLSKEAFMNRFSYSYYNSKNLNKLNIQENTLSFSLDRNSLFIDEKFYPTRHLKSIYFVNKDKDNNLVNYLKDNSIKYLILDNNQKIPSCISVFKIDEIYQKKSIRNFLIENKKKKFELYKILKNKCNL
tara:strand:- start:7877 stop:9640 length:1764 start_codon:yes stop_codon:yes gene_type:complete